jgi:hypothetical protein
VRASLLIEHGRDNAWGIEVAPGVAPEIVENWQGLPCIGRGSPTALNIGTIPFDTSGAAVPGGSSFMARLGHVNYSVYDPQLEIHALGYAKDYEFENGANFFFFAQPRVGLLNGCRVAGSTARARAALPPLPWSGFASPLARLAESPSAVAARRTSATGHGVRVPNVMIGGRRLSRAGITRTMRDLRGQSPHMSALVSLRQAVVIAVLDSLLDHFGSKKRLPQSRVRASVSELVRNYESDPAAANAAGIRVPPNESAQAYFFSPHLVSEYQKLLGVGALRNRIVASARSPLARRTAYQRWLRAALRHSRVSIQGIQPFSLVHALPLGAS